MSSRFQKVIATAVLAGALALGGCGEEVLPVDGTPDPPPPAGNPVDVTAPMLLDARTIGATQLELTFNEAVQLGTVAATDFSLTRNQRNYGLITSTQTYLTGQAYTRFDGVSGTAAGLRHVVTAATAFSSFSAGASPILPIASVQLHPSNSAQILINLAAGVVETDDGATGMLRLTYTAPAGGGIADAAGNALPNIALTNADQGNLREETGSPAIFAARTLDATHIELSFSEPVVTSNAATIAGFFNIADVGIRAYDLGTVSTVFVAVSSSMRTVTNLSLTPLGMKGILTLAGPIPASFDGGTGHLMLTYMGSFETDAIEDADGNLLPDVWPGFNDHGIVVDNI